MTIFTLRVPPGWGPERAWFANEVLTRCLGATPRLVISPGVGSELHLDGSDRVVEMPDAFFAAADAQGGSCHARLPESFPWVPIGDLADRKQGTLLPILFGNAGAGKFASRTERGMRIEADIPGIAFSLLNRLEESQSDARDEHDRFPAKASHALRHDYLHRAIVDEMLNVFIDAVRETWPGAELPVARPRMEVSHDVDHPFCYRFTTPTQTARLLVTAGRMGGEWRHLLGMPYAWLRCVAGDDRMDPCNRFDWMMNEVEKRGLSSTFYFIAGHSGGAIDGNYEIDDAKIGALVVSARRRGHEVGLHPSYQSYLDAGVIAAEMRRLQEVCARGGVEQEKYGSRMHYLRWRVATTWDALEKAGASHDATLGYADRIGFRCGTCHPYRPFDISARRTRGIEVRPLIAMEATVFGKRYMDLGVTDAALSSMAAMKQACRDAGGTFTLLWHNSSLLTRRHRDLFLSVLDS